MTEQEIRPLCEKCAPKYGFDPLLIEAMCDNETHDDETELRLENGFYRKYVRKLKFASTVEVLFSTSWGLMQLMGISLYEMGYFEKFKNSLGGAMPGYAPFDFMRGLDAFMVTPEDQVDYGCRWLRHKMDEAKTTDARLGLIRYNGSAEYADKVLARYDQLKKASK